MAVVETVYTVPMAENFPMPNTNYNTVPKAYHFQIAQYADPATAEDKYVIYHPGSGATTFIGDGPLVRELTSRGYQVLSFAYYGMADASPLSPYRYGYGNVNAPHFTAAWIRFAWEVVSSLEWMLATIGDNPFVLAGHSRGASAVLAWAAGFCGVDTPAPGSYANLRGIFCSAPTIAGLGNLRWNDMNRNLNSISNLWALNELRTVMTFGGDDKYAPPDYVKRLQMVLREDQETYVVTPGATVGHSWINSPQYAEYAGMWLEQLMEQTPITRVDGVTPAVPGPLG